MAEVEVINVKEEEKKSTLIKEASDVHKVMQFLENEEKENFYIVCMNAKNHITHRELITIGTLTNSLVHPREVFRTAIKNNSVSIICVHNHPSGDPAPSREDIEFSIRLVNAGEIIGIRVLDHVIIGKNSYFSMKEKNIVGFNQQGKAESMEQKGEGYFDPEAVVEIYDEMSLHSLSLKAVASLLKESSSDHEDGDPRYGLSQIIEMYIERQESILRKYVDQYENSNIALTESAESTIQMIKEGAFTSKEVATVHLREAIHNLDIVIGRNGGFKGKAEKLKAECNGIYASL